MSDLDLLIIGAGSAGMAAAVTAAARGLSVEVIEERASAGGNLHHQGNREAGERAAPHAPDHARGKELRARFERSGATLTNGTFPWRIEPDGDHANAVVATVELGAGASAQQGTATARRRPTSGSRPTRCRCAS